MSYALNKDNITPDNLSSEEYLYGSFKIILVTFARGSSLAKGEALCIKTGKAYQDERFDLPTVIFFNSFIIAKLIESVLLKVIFASISSAFKSNRNILVLLI